MSHNSNSDASPDTRHVAQPAVSNRSDDVNAPKIPEDPETRGDESQAPELTGRATGTDEDLASLFSNESDEHLRDGFRSGNGDDPDSDVDRSDETPQLDR